MKAAILCEAAAAAALTAILAVAFALLATPAEAAPQPSAQPSKAAVAEFKRQNACPATGDTKGTCPGYVVAHVQPPCAEGLDATANLQWQTVAESREAVRWAQQYCQFRRVRMQGQASA